MPGAKWLHRALYMAEFMQRGLQGALQTSCETNTRVPGGGNVLDRLTAVMGRQCAARLRQVRRDCAATEEALRISKCTLSAAQRRPWDREAHWWLLSCLFSPVFLGPRNTTIAPTISPNISCRQPCSATECGRRTGPPAAGIASPLGNMRSQARWGLPTFAEQWWLGWPTKDRGSGARPKARELVANPLLPPNTSRDRPQLDLPPLQRRPPHAATATPARPCEHAHLGAPGSMACQRRQTAGCRRTTWQSR